LIKNLDGIFEKVEYNENTLILLYKNKEMENYPDHWHNAVEIIMPVEGNYSVETCDERFNLKEGDILIVPPGELHKINSPSEGTRIILQFDMSLLNKLKDTTNILHLMLMPQVITFDKSPVSQRALKNILFEISDEYFKKQDFYETIIFSKLVEMFVIMARDSKVLDTLLVDYKTVKRKEYIQKFNLCLNHINNFYNSDLKLEDVAKIASFSKFHFERLFKQFANRSFYEYLISVRIRNAEVLLSTSSIPITEVAMESGFNSISTFNRVFKEIEGLTPSEFRNRYMDVRDKWGV